MYRFLSNQKLVVPVVYVTTMILNTLDSTIVNVALATLAREFHVSPASIESVVIAYIVSLAVFMPASGWLGDRFGAKRVFMAALFVFTLASALCGLAQSPEQLVLFRILQGAGGGMLTPVGMAMLYRVYPPAERVRIGRILMFATILGPALGPVIGGFMLAHWSWRWIFYVNVPIGVAALLFGGFLLDEQRAADAGTFDVGGFALGGIGFGAVMLALSEGPGRGWSDPLIVGSGLVGVLLLVAFVVVELTVREPMVKLSLLADRLFRSMTVVSVLSRAGFLGALFLLPLMLQEVREETALTAGLTTMPEAIGVVLSTQLVARIFPIIGPRRIMLGGLVMATIALGALGLTDASTSLWWIRILMFVLGMGMAGIFLPNQAASMTTIPKHDLSGASMLYSVQRQLGSAMGIAVVSTVLAIVGTERRNAAGAQLANIHAYQVAFFVAAGFALLAAMATIFVPDEDAAPMMRERQAQATEPAAKRELVEAESLS